MFLFTVAPWDAKDQAVVDDHDLDKEQKQYVSTPFGRFSGGILIMRTLSMVYAKFGENGYKCLQVKQCNRCWKACHRDLLAASNIACAGLCNNPDDLS